MLLKIQKELPHTANESYKNFLKNTLHDLRRWVRKSGVDPRRNHGARGVAKKSADRWTDSISPLYSRCEKGFITKEHIAMHTHLKRALHLITLAMKVFNSNIKLFQAIIVNTILHMNQSPLKRCLL